MLSRIETFLPTQASGIKPNNQQFQCDRFWITIIFYWGIDMTAMNVNCDRGDSAGYDIWERSLYVV